MLVSEWPRSYKRFVHTVKGSPGDVGRLVVVYSLLGEGIDGLWRVCGCQDIVSALWMARAQHVLLKHCTLVLFIMIAPQVIFALPQVIERGQS